MQEKLIINHSTLQNVELLSSGTKELLNTPIKKSKLGTANKLLARLTERIDGFAKEISKLKHDGCKIVKPSN